MVINPRHSIYESPTANVGFWLGQPLMIMQPTPLVVWLALACLHLAVLKPTKGSSDNLSLVTNPARLHFVDCAPGATVQPSTPVARTLLSARQQSSTEACVKACCGSSSQDQLGSTCGAVTRWSTESGCPGQAAGGKSSQGTCQLLLQILAADTGVLQLAPEHGPSLPYRDAKVLGPGDMGTSTFYLATSNSSSGTALDLNAALLAPGAALYVRLCQAELGVPARAGWPAGTITGIAVGALAGLAGLLLGLLHWRRCQRQGGISLKLHPHGDSSSSSSGKQGSSSSRDTEHGNPSRQELPSCTGLSHPVNEGDSRSHESDFQGLNVPTAQWEDVVIPWEDIELQCDADGRAVKLGSGSSGAVYRATIHGATVCAAKQYKFGGDPKAAKRFMQEAGMLWRLNSYCNTHIVSFLGASIRDGEGLLLMEHMAGGDLHDALQTQLPDGRGRLYGWYNRGRRVALQVAVGLQHLHRHSIVHRDVKPKNILLTRDGVAKLGDVGFARMMDPEHISSLSICLGTFEWVAPEVLLGGSATETCSDMYSFGIVLWGVCTGQHPKRGSLRGLSVPDECPQAVADLQLRCVATEPHLRPSAAKAVRVLRSCQRTPRPSWVRSKTSISGKAGMPRTISTPVLCALGSVSSTEPSAFAEACSAMGVSGGCAAGGPAAEAAPTGEGRPLTRKPSLRCVAIAPLMSSMHSPLLMMERAGTAPPGALPELPEYGSMAPWLQPQASSPKPPSACKPPLLPALGDRLGCSVRRSDSE